MHIALWEWYGDVVLPKSFVYGVVEFAGDVEASNGIRYPCLQIEVEGRIPEFLKQDAGFGI